MNKPAKKNAGRPADVKKAENVTIDLGETIEKRLLAAGLRTDLGKTGSGIKAGNLGGGPAGGQKPGLFGGYRPWYNRFGRPGMGDDMATGRTFQIIPSAIRQVQTTHLLTGLGLGILGNRTLIRVAPRLWSSPQMLYEGMAFVAGLIPLLVTRNAYTVGVAIPGLVVVGGSIVDAILDWAGLGAPKALGLSGAGAPRQEALAARQKLASIQNRINVAQAQGQTAQRPVPRVVAQAQSA